MKAKILKITILMVALTAFSANAFATGTGEDSKAKANDDCAKAFNVKTTPSTQKKSDKKVGSTDKTPSADKADK